MDQSFSRAGRMTDRERLREAIIVAIVAALSIVSKPYVRLVFAPLAGSLHVPAGVFAGCVYMIWLVLVDRLVPRTGAVLRLAALQGVLALAMGMTSQAGPLIMLAYLGPGAAVELLRLCVRPHLRKSSYSMAAGALANLTGSLAMTMITVGWKPAVVWTAADAVKPGAPLVHESMGDTAGYRRPSSRRRAPTSPTGGASARGTLRRGGGRPSRRSFEAYYRVPHADHAAMETRAAKAEIGADTDISISMAKAEAGPDQIRDWLQSNICRCTGYEEIRDAVESVLRTRRPGSSGAAT